MVSASSPGHVAPTRWLPVLRVGKDPVLLVGLGLVLGALGPVLGAAHDLEVVPVVGAALA